VGERELAGAGADLDGARRGEGARAVQGGEPGLARRIPSALALAAQAGGAGKGRAALSEALVGAQVAAIDGLLLVRVRDAAQRDFIQDRFGADLVGAAVEFGFEAVMVTVREAVEQVA
jgi:hypothetical protein